MSSQNPHRYVGYHPAPNDDHRPARGSRAHHAQQRQQQQQQRQQPQAHHSGSHRGGGGSGGHHHRTPVSQHTHHMSRESREEFDRSGRLLTLGTVFMLFGLILYFGGGYLFVAAYNGIYPIINIPVDPSIHR